ncbi:NUDIX hydrolase [Patescibacteria group bacterium]
MTRSGSKNFKPEPFFRFVNVFIYNLLTQEFLFVLQKDRQAKNIWTPVGGEIELPNTAEQTAIIEAQEEVGIEIKILETIRVAELYYDQSIYWAKHQAHVEIVEFLAIITQGIPVLKPQPDEQDYEIIDLAWYSHGQFKELLQIGEIKTYPSIIVSMDIIRNRLKYSRKIVG